MFIRTTTYTARTGMREFDLPYHCENCQRPSTARVWAEGSSKSVAVYGLGGSAENARNAAENGALANARMALASAPCPLCREYPRYRQWAVANADHLERKRLARRWPMTLGGAVVAAGFSGLLALSDPSWEWLVVAMGAALVGSGFMLWLHTKNVTRPLLAPPPNVWFWPQEQFNDYRQNPVVGGTPPLSATQARSGNSTLAVLGFLGACAGAVTGLTGLGLWSGARKHIDVLNTMPSGDLIVKIDGKEVGRVGPEAKHGSDVPYEQYTVKLGPHTIEAIDAAGRTVSRAELTATRSTRSYVFAPEAMKNGACIFSEQALYGTHHDKTEPEIKLLNAGKDLFELPQSFYHQWEKPPSSVSTKSSSETRETLRAYACPDGRDRDVLPPFAEAKKAGTLRDLSKLLDDAGDDEPTEKQVKADEAASAAAAPKGAPATVRTNATAPAKRK